MATKKAASKKAAASKDAAKPAEAEPVKDGEVKPEAKAKAGAKAGVKSKGKATGEASSNPPVAANGGNMTPFVKDQKQKLIDLRDMLVDAMAGVAQDNLRSRADGSEASAFGMHQADAGSDAYDRDFALNLLSQEQDALYEIEEALKRIADGTYGVCEISGQVIPEARLEAIPFARLTVECQEQFEKQMGNRGRHYGRPTRSLFGLMDNAADGDSVDSD